ncbi:alpha-ketoacid dehydrogenase subunit beta [Cognatishimia sp.]|uniref:alpha-ketoacid dehydrogenase subunit beta n=1 Tax=Cognatishimia sp. TaxID=2211648 RepID=UPI00351123D1|nr:alpha-ketoacid dehydrogenase subunit beta [Cognatishimia sp.]
MARMRFIQAINQALHQEMARDEKIILIGEDVEASIFGDTRGLLNAFGPDRVRNTPISEATLTGMAVGAAANGYKVVLHMMFANFIYTGFDAIANQMAKLRLMTGGQISLPITIIASYGGGRSTAAQHSDSPYPALMNLGGINVLTPATPADASGLLKTALRGNDPCIFLEPGGRGGESGDVPEDTTVPFGVANLPAEGSDVSIVTMGSSLKPTLQAAKKLSKQGIAADVIDLRTLVPMDKEAIIASVRKTGRLVIADEARDTCSAASHIAALVADEAFGDLKAPIRRVTVPDVSMPYAPNSEKPLLPTAERIIDAVSSVVK